MIKRFTITGADESVQPLDLLKLWEIFPFVEWGILVSRKSFGMPRFPSIEWIHKLKSLKRANPGLPLSIHLCGACVRELLKGDSSFIDGIKGYWEIFDRVQMNTHGQDHSFGSQFMHDFIQENGAKEFIFQYDQSNVSKDLYHPLSETETIGKRVTALFDLSHGAGVLPDQWPVPLDGKCGYAGGLSPDNLELQIKAIERMAGEREIWIDMETHVRSNNDNQFDLDKVRRCLDIAEPFIK